MGDSTSASAHGGEAATTDADAPLEHGPQNEVHQRAVSLTEAPAESSTDGTPVADAVAAITGGEVNVCGRWP